MDPIHLFCNKFIYLQPFAVVDESTCAACIFNKPENKCKRNLKWTWRGDYIVVRLLAAASISWPFRDMIIEDLPFWFE